MEARIKLKHGRFGICWLESLDIETYSIPMATVSCVKLGEPICRPLYEFELAGDNPCREDHIAVRYLS